MSKNGLSALLAWLLPLALGTVAAAAQPPRPRGPPGADPLLLEPEQLNAEGLLLATQFLLLTESAGKAGGGSVFVKALMSPAYQIATYTPPDLVSYDVSGAVATQPAPGVLVVRYYVAANETLHGRQLITARRPRLTVFARGAVDGLPGDSSWRLVSHAGFNEPTERECDTGDPDPDAPPQGDAADVGMAVLRDWMAYVAAGRGIDVVNDQIQVQFANGSGYATRTELAPIRPMAIDGVRHVVATRSGQLLVVSYNATTRAAPGTERPHLTVFLQDGGPLAGAWSMIAQCNFNSPKLPRTDPACAATSDASKCAGPAAGFVLFAAMGLAALVVGTL